MSRAIPETVPEELPGGDAPYTSFSGSPSSPWGEAADADEMEATVASLVYESLADYITPDVSNITNWLDFGPDIPADAIRQSGKFVCEATAEQIAALLPEQQRRILEDAPSQARTRAALR